MAKLKRISEDTFKFHCPACGKEHVIKAGAKYSPPYVWYFNGDINKPTFSPTVMARWGKYADPDWKEPAEPGNWSGKCHFEIRDGKITFLKDSTHSMAEQTIDMPDVVYGSGASAVA